MKYFRLSAASLSILAIAVTNPATPAESGAKKRAPAASAARTAAPAAPPASRPPKQDDVTLNFVNADIEGVVKAVSEITGRNFVLDPRVKGTVNIISSKPMSRALVYDVFVSALRLQGYAAVEGRDMVKIVPEAEAKLQSGTTIGPQDRAIARGDQIVTQVFALKYESAAQLVPILRPLIAPNNTITAYASSNTLVVTDYAGNLKRIERIIESIDQPSGTDPVVIPLASASALDVAQTINKLYAESAQAPGAGAAEANRRVMVVADARSNSLLVQSDNPSALLRVRSLIGMLDSPTSAAGNIHVVFLKNAEAVKIAETLRAIYSGDTSSGRPPTPMQAPAGLGPAGYPGTSAATATAPRMNASPQVTSQTTATPGIIQADVATNSIIITAPDAIYNNLRAVVEKLDVRRTQVYVEALVAEITAANAAEFGIQWQNLTGGNATTAKAIGGTNFGTAGQNILGVSQNPTAASQGLNIGVVKGTVTIGGVQILNLGLLVRALESNNSANILSTPTLLTMDNQEATIVVGQNVPFITGQYAVSGAATTPTPFQTIERKDVGLTLRIKPQISEGGTVRLQVYQEVSSIDSSSNPSGLITNKRSLESTVMVDDGQIVVIGGLLQDSVGDGEGKVPLLGDLPVLGSLFRYNTRTRTKTNLMVFLRPTILRTAQGAETITGDRYDFIRGEQSKPGARPSEVLPTYPKPVLPPREEGAKAATPAPK